MRRNNFLRQWMIFCGFVLGFAFQNLNATGLADRDGVEYPGQPISVSGTVSDQDGMALIGVNVLVAGTDNGTSTDLDGYYMLEDVADDAVLIFSYVGYETVEVAVEGRTSIDVTMISDAQVLDELVVVGYGSVKKSDLTGSVERIDAEKFKNQAMTQITDMLTGTVAGFNANQSTSAAGGSSLEIRGRTSLTASTDPLIVLDGVIFNGSLRDINPNDIESIDILKDASSAAIFGSKAASGVILITTTKGNTGKPVINLTSRIGVSQLNSDQYGVRGPEEYIDFRKEYYRSLVQPFPDTYWDDPNNLSEGLTLEQWRAMNPNPLPDDTREYLSRLNFFPTEIEAYLSGETIDWIDETFRNAVRQDYDLSVSGGTDNSRYYWSMGYVDNEGIILGDEFSAVRSRLNVDFDITPWLNVGTNTQFTIRDESTVTANLGGMQTTSPFAKMRNEDGTIKWYPGDYVGGVNPLINTLGQDRERKINSLFSSLFAKVKLPFGIEYKLSFQPRFQTIRDYNYWSPETIVGGQNVSGGRAQRLDYHQYEWMVDNLLTWSKEFGIHNFNVTLLQNVEQNRTWQSYQVNNTFLPSPTLGYSGTQFGINPALESYDQKVTGDALMARLNYSLMDRYLFTASIRRDGYSAFGQEHPRATFPALAFAWKLSDEEFFDVGAINQLKVRTSWGVNGNRDIGPYAALAQLGSVQYYDGSQVQIGVGTSSLENRQLVWEETSSLNFGVDLSLMESRFQLTLDYYDMVTNNLLVNRILPRLTGFSSITTNIGELANKGFEMTLRSANITTNQFDWSSTLNFALNRNKINRLFGVEGDFVFEGEDYFGEIPDFSNEWFPGHAIDAIWNYDIVGIWQEEERDEAAQYNLEPGDFKAVDLDGNGTYEAVRDKTFLGFREPRYRLGLRNDFTIFRNLTASLFIRADLGHMRNFGPAIHRHSTYDRRNTPPVPYWTKENRSNDWPRLSQNDAPYGGGIDLFKPSSFVRIQDFTLNYSFPLETLNQINFKSLQLFGSVRNLYTISDWPGWDPESGFSPMPRTYTVGLNLSL